MTKLQLDLISKEISEIETELSILDPNNSFESHRVSALNFRLEQLDSVLDIGLVEAKRSHLTLVQPNSSEPQQDAAFVAS